MARRFWPNGDPLNDRLIVGKGMRPEYDQEPLRQIVGIVGNVRDTGLTRPPRPAMYVPMAQEPDGVTRLNVRLLLICGQPLAPVGAHVLDQRDEGAALAGELIGHPRWHLGEGAALDDPLLLERPQAQRQGAGTDPLEGALELTEPERVIGEVADDEEGPLAGDDLRRPADWTFAVEHEAQNSAKALLCEALYPVTRLISSGVPMAASSPSNIMPMRSATPKARSRSWLTTPARATGR